MKMAENIVTVKTWDEFKNAMNTKINGGDTLIISIAADLTDTEQHELPAPAQNYWATIEKIGTSSANSYIKIIGNDHTISGINIPDTYNYTAILLYKDTAGGTIDINIHNLKFINIKTPSIQLRKSTGANINVNLINCVITGMFDIYYAIISKLYQCNIVQISPRSQNIWASQKYYFIAEELYSTHYYYTHLNNTTTDDHPPAKVFDNSYIELNPGLTNLAEHTILGHQGYYDLTTFNQSCINCNKKLVLSFGSYNNTPKGVTILNCTNNQSDIPTKLKDKIKIITDEQMKNADYLNSIGFTVTPTN